MELTEICLNTHSHQPICLLDCLAWENAQPRTHEFVRGHVRAAVDLLHVHACVVSNLICLVSAALDGCGCQLFANSLKVQIENDTVLYPNVFVTCDKSDLATDMIFRSPKLVIEVLSPSTQAYDRSQKFAFYRRLPSLQEYLLIDPETRRFEAFRRGADGLWDLHDMSDGDTLEAPCIGASIAMADVFAGIDPPA
jgi:Uma2 family endonuclease